MTTNQTQNTNSKDPGFQNLSFLPNMITLCNLFTGFVSILMASRGHFRTACYLVIVSIIWDSLDGNVAKMFKNPTELGKQLDSLADVVSFVVAPCFIVAMLLFPNLGPGVFLVLFAYLGCGTLRLAMFNLAPSVPDQFTGLPTPGAAIVMNLVVAASIENHWDKQAFFHPALLGLMALISFLMVSKVPYPKFSGMPFSRWSLYLYADILLACLAGVLVNLETALAVVPLFFLFICPAICIPFFQAAPARKS